MDKLYDVYEFIFVEDGPYSIAAFCIVAYFGIRFIVFPVIGFAAGTSLPIVAVISDSMVHGEGWEESPAICPDGTPCSQRDFYAQYNISMDEFDSFRFDSGFNKGDVMLVRGENSYEVGDVVVYQADNRPPVIHRVIRVQGDEYVVKGDNNRAPIQSTGEYRLEESRIIGSAYARLPFLGWVKIGVVNALQAIFEVFT